MKKFVCFALVVVFSMLGALNQVGGVQSSSPGAKPEGEIRLLVEKFGQRLKHVPLQAPRHTLAQCMLNQYGEFVAPALLAKWIDNPQEAPGRLVSSPWPDRIEINGVQTISQSAWAVQGYIIEVTSDRDGAAIMRPVTLVVIKQKGRWLIDTVILGDYH